MNTFSWKITNLLRKLRSEKSELQKLKVVEIKAKTESHNGRICNR